MKNLFVLILVISLFSCKDDEPTLTPLGGNPTQDISATIDGNAYSISPTNEGFQTITSSNGSIRVTSYMEDEDGRLEISAPLIFVSDIDELRDAFESTSLTSNLFTEDNILIAVTIDDVTFVSAESPVDIRLGNDKNGENGKYFDVTIEFEDLEMVSLDGTEEIVFDGSVVVPFGI